jgi:hypothetical protein
VKQSRIVLCVLLDWLATPNPAGIVISFLAMPTQKTLFLPYFKHKTTLVEQKITYTFQPYSLLFIASGLLRRFIPRNDEQNKEQKNLCNSWTKKQENSLTNC